ncbi:MAG: sodium:proton antiporter [Coxiellaceae bacterium]|nr:sodium:proton antiporter [Coxiellaceae bacterium]
MNAYTMLAIIITLAVLIGYINHRFIRLQMTIAIMAGAMILSLLLLFLQYTGATNITPHVTAMIENLDFRHLLLNGMLSFLLFAGAFTVDLDLLKQQRWQIGILASVSTVASALIIGYLAYLLLPFLGIHVPLLYCFLFGSLISPTDPIAVLATFKEVGAPKALEVCVAGESLFNDGVGIVMFTTLYQLAFTSTTITAGSVTLLFLKQAVGGIAYGVIISWVVSNLLKSAKGRKMAMLLTIALVTGGYQLALAIDISGPLAMVVAGIYLGHQARRGDFGKSTVEAMDVFWELIDEILNAVLFLLIGLELLTLNIHGKQMIAVFAAIPIVLLVRLITVAIPMRALKHRGKTAPYTISILTWGGLRGGLAVALALSLPAGSDRHLILAMTYAIVAFAVIVQGLSIKSLVRLSKQS